MTDKLSLGNQGDAEPSNRRAAIGSEDIVCCKVGSTFKFGVVTQSYNDDSSSSESEDDDNAEESEKSEKIKEGFAKVAWFNVGMGGSEGETRVLEAKKKKGIEEQVVSERKLKLVDRALMPGDAVRRTIAINDNSKPQRGFVKRVKLMFDVAMISNRDLRLYNVPASRFCGPVPYSVGCFCVYNFYLGEIDSVNNTVRFELRNGFVYEVKESILRRYATDAHDPLEKYSYYHKSFFYPTQQLKINVRVLESAVCVLASPNQQSFEDLKKRKFLKAEVVSIFTTSVKISWILRCYSGNSENDTQINELEEESVPAKTLYNPQLKNLKILTDYIYLSYSLGDKVMLKLTQTDLREIERVDKKFHCGGDIKDHISDMKAKQMSRNKYGGRFHRKKPVSKRVHHTAEVLPDSHLNSKVAIPPRPSSVVTAADVMTSFNRILDLNKINRRDVNELKAIASKSSYYISKTFLADDDYPATIIDLLTTLKDRNQLQEHDLVRFFLNGRARPSDLDDNFSPFVLSTKLCLDYSEQVILTPTFDESASGNNRKVSNDVASLPFEESDNEQVFANDQNQLPIPKTDTAFLDEANGTQSNEDCYSVENRLKASKQKSATVSSNSESLDAERLAPVFDSTHDLAICLNSMLSTWKDVMKTRDPSWNESAAECMSGQSPSSEEFEALQEDGKKTETDDETETVSTFGADEKEDFRGGGTAGVGDPYECSDCEYSKTANANLTGSRFQSGVPNKNARSLKPGENAAFTIIMTKTFVTVMWQDGSLEEDIPSTEVETLHHLDENEFFPGDFVVDSRKESAGLELYGVVQSADFLERVCTVKWFSDAANDRRAFLFKEQVSVYDINDLEHLDLNMLDIVARISEEDERLPEEIGPTGNLTTGKLFGTGTAGAVIDIQLSTGLVLVLWVEGYRSLVPHHCLININDSEMVSELMDDDQTTLSSSGEDVENASENDSWTTASDDAEATLDLDEVALGDSADAESSPINEEGLHLEVEEKITEAEETMVPNGFDESELSSDMANMKMTPSELELTETSDVMQKLSSPMSSLDSKVANHLSRKFATFEVLPTVQCHRFVASSDIPQSKVFLTTLKKELKVLSSALPDGIFVRTFEDRNDLFSCLIVGAEDTPYEQGLFLFDIKLPMHYPVDPPEVLYLSYASGKLNPNLYEDGKICLSLLGTWNGKGTEVWSKDSSSLLQVFVSLQALILNKTPYFNEAGYEKQRSLLTGQENAKMYNEMVVLRLVETCTAMINSPYETFEQEILEHFGFVGQKLIGRLQLWCDTQDSSTIPSPSFPLFPLSTGFRNSLDRELRKFKAAVCERFDHKEESSHDQENTEGCQSAKEERNSTNRLI